MNKQLTFRHQENQHADSAVAAANKKRLAKIITGAIRDRKETMRAIRSQYLRQYEDVKQDYEDEKRLWKASQARENSRRDCHNKRAFFFEELRNANISRPNAA